MMRQNGSARVALLFSLAVCVIAVGMVLSSSAFGDTKAPRFRTDTCLPTSVAPGVPSCLPGGSSASASTSKSPSGSVSPSKSTTSPAGGGSFSSKITIGFKKGSFKGKVSSSSKKCVGGRDVVLYQRKTSRKGTPVGNDTTSSRGQWKVTKVAKTHGKFYAVVKKSKVSSGTCKPAKSKTISR